MPNVKLVRAIFICSSFKWIEPLFFELSCTQTDRQTDTHTYAHAHTHTHTHTHTPHTHTDRHEYSIVAVDKLQL